VLVDDGRLPHPGVEAIAEAYYTWRLWKLLDLSLDYRLVGTPATTAIADR
jgi:high affinity Mn2+ porin